MRIHIDLTHPAHANFFRYLVPELAEDGHSVTVSCLSRGRLPSIVSDLFQGFRINVVGTYGRSLPAMAFHTGLARLVRLAVLFRSVRPEVVAGVAAFQPAMISGICGFRTVGIYDDPEHRLNYRLTRRLVDTFVVPECLEEPMPGAIPFRGLKEWAYLRPGRFVPDPEVPRALGLEPGGYIFIRSVDTASLNYRGQDPDVVRRLYSAGLERMEAVLSLERKEDALSFPGWMLLEEPVPDIHSLMYFSRMVLSSGDSMAREGAELGVPSVYCGTREMKANRELAEMGFLRMTGDPEEIALLTSGSGSGDPWTEREARRNILLGRWEDPAEVMRKAILGELQGDERTERTVR